MKQSKIDKFALSVLPRKWFELGVDEKALSRFDFVKVGESCEVFSNKNVKKAKISFAIAVAATVYGVHCWNSAVATEGVGLMADRMCKHYVGGGN